MVGSIVSHYRVLDRLGQGGMGVVYKAEDTRLGRMVALKFLADRIAGDPQALERFKREARAASALNHPNICTIYDIDEHLGRPFIVMELLEGRTLRNTISGKPLPLDQIVAFASEIADALDQAHGRGILHRDINPANIFITNDGHAKLVDFGLAKRAHSISDVSAMTTYAAQDFTQTGAVVGTVAYMSPEQARGEPVDARTDLYSLGVVLYEMATGRVAFTGSTVAVLYDAILNRKPQSVLQLYPATSPDLDRIIGRLLSKQPSLRHQSARELLDELRALQRTSEERRPFSSRSLPRAVPSIAVLPFANLSPDPENEYFSDGMTEEIINALIQLPGLRVAGRTSSFTFKGRTPDLAEVASKLKVAAVLSGSVRKAGTRLRVTVELVNVGDGFSMWSDRYDCEADDVFKVQDDIASAIAEKLKVALIGPAEPLVRPPTLNFQAYELYLRGRVMLNQRSGIARAIECFHQALELDPDFALAWSSLAEANMLLGFYGYLPASEAMPAAKQAAQRALEIDPDLAEPHVPLAFISWMYDWDWEATRREFGKATEMNPVFPWTHVWQSLFLGCTEGKFGEAVTEGRRACELDPLSGPAHTALGWVLYCAGRLKEAEDVARRGLSVEPMLWTAYRVLGVTLAAQGRFAEAIETLEAALPISGRHIWIVVNLAEVFAVSGQPERAKRLFDEIIARSRSQYVQPLFFGLIYAAMGDYDTAFEIYERGFAERDVLPIMNYSPVTGSTLRKDPRYGALVRRLGLVPAPDLA